MNFGNKLTASVPMSSYPGSKTKPTCEAKEIIRIKRTDRPLQSLGVHSTVHVAIGKNGLNVNKAKGEKVWLNARNLLNDCPAPKYFSC